MTATNRLHIWVGQQHAANLEQSDQTFTLTYTAAWQQSREAFAFSPHLPLHLSLNQIHHGASVKNFFSNLLPEGEPSYKQIVVPVASPAICAFHITQPVELYQ